MQFLFHFTPAYGWMNDPNGLIDVDGTHHLFFQHNPFSPEVGPSSGKIHWGHATSTDFVHWRELPAALSPGDAGDYDARGCYSGCAVQLDDGRIAAVYSGHTAGGELPCLAFADDPDLFRWTKSPLNPVIASWPPLRGVTDFRDHSITRRGADWEQWIAVGSEEGGMVVGYTSRDFEHWEFAGVLISAQASGLPDGVWECPDVFEIDGTTVVIVSWFTDDERETIWVTGTRDSTGFTAERWGRLDLGPLLYAPQSYWTEDGRRVLFGWLQTVKDPAATGEPNMGAQSIPRVLGVRDGVLTQEPASEIERLRADALVSQWVADATSVELDEAEAFEILLEGEGLVGGAELVLESSDGRSLKVPLVEFGGTSYLVREDVVWTEHRRQINGIRILFDRGLVEAFADDGRAIAVSDLSIRSIGRVLVRRMGQGTGPIRLQIAELHVVAAIDAVE